MAVTPRMLCLILALICFAVAGFWSPQAGGRPFNLVAVGLGLLALALLLGPP
jgi:hypothetical protein